MRRHGSRLALLAVLVAGAFGCASDLSRPNSGGVGGNVGRQDASGTGGSSASGGSAGGGAGRGGSGSGGSGTGGAGGSTGGSGGSTGGSSSTGGSGVGGSGGAGGQDASAGADGGAPDAQANPCTVSLAPLAPQRWANLAAAPGSKLRVGATAIGFQVPAKPAFEWRVTFNGMNLLTTVVGGDPAVVEFDTAMIGQYQISVSVAGVAPACTTSETANAIAPNNLVAQYLIRAIAPEAIAPELRGLAPLEAELTVAVGEMPTKTLELRPGQEITVQAVDEGGTELPSYFVQLRSRTSTARLEGFVDASLPGRRFLGFRALVDQQTYDLLVIPVTGPGADVRAPRLYPRVPTIDIQRQDYVMRPGTRVAGTISAAGVPLPDARVRLRDGLLPSTIGETSASGAYELRVRGPRSPASRFEVRVLPPARTGLPEAQLAASAGVYILDGAPDLSLDFQYAAIPTSQLVVTVTSPAGGPVTGPVEVLLQSLEGELANVGNFALPQGPVPGSGSFRLLRTSDGPAVNLGPVPRARYRVTVAPPPDLPGDLGITSEEIDLRAAGAAVARSVALKARTPVPGRLTGPAPFVGLKVRATDSGEDGFRRTVIVNVGSDGAYTIPADQGRLYRVSVEPTADRSVPRIPLIPIRGQALPSGNVQALPRIQTVKGSALVGNGKPVAGAVIQIYCLGNAPDCVAQERESRDLASTLPIDETISGADGSYDLRIPEPN